MTARSQIVVVGDVTLDWNTACVLRREGGVGWSFNDRSRVFLQPGGAALLGDLIRAVASTLPEQPEVIGPKLADAPLVPQSRAFNHSHALWARLSDPKRKAGPSGAWRVQEFLGTDRAVPPTDSGTASGELPQPDLLVIDDAALGFRDRREDWSRLLEGVAPRWILLKMSRPIAQGDLWQALHRQHAERLVVVMGVNDLRCTNVQISRDLSWETTAQDLFWELVRNLEVNALSQCAHVVVACGAAGAFVLSRDEDAAESAAPRHRGRLIFDPKATEGAWGQGSGAMIGYNTCLAAALARELMTAKGEPDIAQGVQNGLRAMRVLHQEGYGDGSADLEQAAVLFPIARIARELGTDGATFADTPVQDPTEHLAEAVAEAGRGHAVWSILQERHTNALGPLAQRIATEGVESVLTGVPMGQFGKFTTVDRKEIESFRSVAALIVEYCRQSQTRPLSIAVFGAPGSGKSFGVTQVARAVLPGEVKDLTFNLSQMTDRRALLGAFHQVRDVALSGLVPLVFWDEFDCSVGENRFAWLSQFLAPMQDGTFLEGQITHPIGRAIFVFAGGTSAAREEFGAGMSDEAFRAAKGPDFLSRLRGYVNVMGPNRQGRSRDDDAHHVIRRAILLRSILQRHAPQLFSETDGQGRLAVDPGVLRAFLETREYKHGARSMESVVTMSRLSGSRSFERSCLPAAAQLELHVQALDFLALVQQPELSDLLLGKLAAAAHRVFCESLRAQGFTHGPRNDQAKTHDHLVDYEQLPAAVQQENRENVRDIPRKLAEIGYVMMPARGNQRPFDFPGPRLEALSDAEHTRWMKMKLAAGWRWGAAIDRAAKLHPDLVLWRELAAGEPSADFTLAEREALGPGALSDEAKEKDRVLVRGIPRIVAEAGYAIVEV